MSPEKYIYLDHAATTKMCPQAKAALVKYADEWYFNPSAGYSPALEVKAALKDATATVADLLGASDDEIIFTSGATESNNTAFECGIKNKKGNIVVSATEHASVYESALRLKSKGADVRFVSSTKDGAVTPTALAEVMDENTAFVSILHCSNETGVVNDIAALCETAKSVSPRVVFHSDGVQAFCKIGTDLHDLGVDLYSVSAHKVGGAKGVGALYVRRGWHLPPFIAGGGQQNGRRSGTENVGGIVGFAAAAKEFRRCAATFDANALRNAVIERFSSLDWVRVNGNGANSGYILSLSFRGLKGEVLAHMAEERGVLVGLGSACSAHVKTNRVLEAMQVPKDFAGGSIRISFGPENTEEEIKHATDILFESAEKLRSVIYG